MEPRKSEGEALLVGLQGEDEATRLLACEQLVAAGEPLSPPLAAAVDRLLAGPRPPERLAAARVLARCWPAGHDPAGLVAAALAEDHPLLRAALIRTLDQASTVDATARESVSGALLSVLGDRGSTPRRRAAEIASRIASLAGNDAVLGGLAGLLSDDSGPTRAAALVALGALGGSPLVIAPLLADPQIDVAREALRALLCLDPTSPVALPALLRALQGERPGLEVVAVDGLVAAARRSPLSAPPAALEALAALLRSAVETPLREAACDAIGLLGGAAEAEILAGLLHEPSWGLRSAIVDALFALHERGVPVTGLLLPRLDEGPLSARIEIMQALGALGRHDPLVRQRILAVTLQETRHTQREAVSHALREAACHALSLCGGTEEALALLPHLALATPVMLRRRALLAVRSVCLSLVEGPVPPVVPPALLDALGRTLTDPDDRCRRLACECHGVLSASPDDGLRAATHRALPGLMRRLCERHERVARAARVALSRLKPQAPLDPALLTTPPGFGAVFASLLREDGWSPALHDELARRLRSRIQWFGVILSLSPPPELPSTLPGLAELLVERARLFGERRRNCGGADGAQLREQAWVIAQAYSLLSR